MRIRVLSLIISSLLASTAAFAEEEQAPAANSAEQTAQTICAACHGADGNSPLAVNPNLAGQHPEYLYKQMADFKAGKRENAVMGGMVAALSEKDMQALADYFASQAPTMAKAKAQGVGSLGEKIYRGGIMATNVPACASCHGANGEGMPKRFPRVSGQHAEYTVQQLKTFRTGVRANAPMMQVISAKMTEAEMEAVADYIQGLR